MLIKCKHCNADFQKGRSDKIFCSRRCKQKNKDKRLKKKRIRVRKYRLHLKDSCENCGFVPIHECQLDVDHIDGNHNNDSPENLRTLCANCHRLKTYINKDWR